MTGCQVGRAGLVAVTDRRFRFGVPARQDAAALDRSAAVSSRLGP
jgi:hypothetical protein